MNDDINAIKRTLRAYDLPATAARIAVLQVLQEGQGHRSAEEVRAAILARYPTINLVTVYRTLELLEAHGLVDRVTLGDKVLRWERATHAHHHLVCRDCGSVVELATEPFRRLVADLERSHGVQADIRHLALHGLCGSCAASHHDHDPPVASRQAVLDGPRE